MDEATRKMIAEEFTIWGHFLTGCVIIWEWAWFYYITSSQSSTFPRLAKFFLWLMGITALAVFILYGLMNTLPFCEDCLNPLHSWMRVVIGLAYLAVVGYIIKRRGEIRTP